MKKVLFVTYGSGHVKMVVPVARALAEAGDVESVVLALTTAAPVARAAGLPTLQFRDFVTGSDTAALAHGERLMASLGAPVADVDETRAYLGLSFSDLVETSGLAAAQAAYATLGRQSFLPVRTLERVLRQVRPDLVVATNSPRAERAAVVAARGLGIPAVCVVDLFAIDEVKWIGAPDYADRVCVLNESVRRFLIAAGRSPDQVCVTGNPGFDALFAPQVIAAAQALREREGWNRKHVVLLPIQTEPAVHPFDGRPGNPQLPAQLLQRLLRWVMAREDTVLCVRPRAGEAPPDLPTDPRVRVTGQDWPLAELLHATDVVVTLNSTVGLEGSLTGTRLIQVLGSVFDQAMPLLDYGIADEAVALDQLEGALARQVVQPRRIADSGLRATERVVEVLRTFL